MVQKLTLLNNYIQLLNFPPFSILKYPLEKKIASADIRDFYLYHEDKKLLAFYKNVSTDITN